MCVKVIARQSGDTFLGHSDRRLNFRKLIKCSVKIHTDSGRLRVSRQGRPTKTGEWNSRWHQTSYVLCMTEYSA